MGEKRRADGERQGQQSGAGLEALDQERELIPASILRAFDAQPQPQAQAEPQPPPPADSIQAMMSQPVPAVPAPRANEDPWVRHIRALRLERAKEASNWRPAIGSGIGG